ncbi:hypothetical protein [Tenacibaculum sp.]|uniref:hypothetical protein n=1 Tax=Tenacibaculum sp. TaxID=1906242 RepID=UPI003AA985D2
MNINNTNKYIFLIITLLFLSCKEKQQASTIEEENTYQIIGLLLSDLRGSTVLPPEFPPPPPGEDTYEFTTKDSLWSYKYFYKQTVRKKTIAFWPQISVSKKNIKKKSYK